MALDKTAVINLDRTLSKALEGSGELDIEIAKAVGLIHESCYFSDHDPESGHAGYSSPAYDAHLLEESKIFLRTGELPDTPDWILNEDHFGYSRNYSRSIDDALTLIPDGFTVDLSTHTGGGETMHSCGLHGKVWAARSANTLPLAIVRAWLRASQTLDSLKD